VTINKTAGVAGELGPEMAQGQGHCNPVTEAGPKGK
jgi:hypothetical protein